MSSMWQLVCKKCKHVFTIKALGSSPSNTESKCPNCGYGIAEKKKMN